MNLLGAIDFSGLGEAKKKEKKPEKPVPAPRPVGMVPTPKGSLPKWLPWAIGGVGVVVVIGLLVTSQGKD